MKVREKKEGENERICNLKGKESKYKKKRKEVKQEGKEMTKRR